MKPGVLVMSGVLHGMITGWSFRRYSNRAALRVAVNRIIAHVLEFRLFVDEPRLIFRAQRDLLLANLAMLRALAVPVLAGFLMLAAAWLPLAGSVGLAPLNAGDVTLVEVASPKASLDLAAPFGVVVETPALHLKSEGITLWRIRALSPVNGDFRTLPTPLSVRVHFREARYLGMPWWLAFALISAIASTGILMSRRTR